MKCPLCGGNVIFNGVEYVCEKCGYVLDNPPIEYKDDIRYNSYSEYVSKLRVEKLRDAVYTLSEDEKLNKRIIKIELQGDKKAYLEHYVKVLTMEILDILSKVTDDAQQYYDEIAELVRQLKLKGMAATLTRKLAIAYLVLSKRKRIDKYEFLQKALGRENIDKSFYNTFKRNIRKLKQQLNITVKKFFEDYVSEYVDKMEMLGILDVNLWSYILSFADKIENATPATVAKVLVYFYLLCKFENKSEVYTYLRKLGIKVTQSIRKHLLQLINKLTVESDMEKYPPEIRHFLNKVIDYANVKKQ